MSDQETDHWLDGMHKQGFERAPLSDLEEAAVRTCNCDNARFGFECMCDWEAKHPGDTWFSCEFCGLYQAAKPRCGRCEEDLSL